MKIINDTLLNFKIINSELIVRAVYTEGPDFRLDSRLTNLEAYDLPQPSDHSVEVHDLQEEEIRGARLLYKGQEVLPLNPQSFWSHLSNTLKRINKSTQAVAYFQLPVRSLAESLVYRSSKGAETHINFKDIPWRVYSMREMERLEIHPRVLKLEIYPLQQIFKVYLAYPAPASEEGLVYVEYLKVPSMIHS